LLAEVIEEAVHQSEAESVRIGDGEMALRETLQAVGGSALKQFLENADGEQEADRVCLWRKTEIPKASDCDNLERVWQSGL
jgi:hypothetical protein